MNTSAPVASAAAQNGRRRAAPRAPPPNGGLVPWEGAPGTAHHVVHAGGLLRLQDALDPHELGHRRADLPPTELDDLLRALPDDARPPFFLRRRFAGQLRHDDVRVGVNDHDRLLSPVKDQHHRSGDDQYRPPPPEETPPPPRPAPPPPPPPPRSRRPLPPGRARHERRQQDRRGHRDGGQRQDHSDGREGQRD